MQVNLLCFGAYGPNNTQMEEYIFQVEFLRRYIIIVNIRYKINQSEVTIGTKSNLK